jgi:hypothetical protein
MSDVFERVGLLCIGLLFGWALTLCWQERYPVPSTIKPVIQWRHDTLCRIDTVLDHKIKVIHTLPDTEVIAIFDTLYRDTGKSDTVKTTVFAERRCLEVTDSLAACTAKLKVDDTAFAKIDTFITKPTQSISLKQHLIDIGIGVLVGFGLRGVI